MGILHKGLKDMINKDGFSERVESFTDIIVSSFPNLMAIRGKAVLKMNGEDIFIDCNGFGIIVTSGDEISIHT